MLDQNVIDGLRQTRIPAQKLFVNGTWTEAKDGAVKEVISPTDGSVLTSIARGTREDVDAAVAAARAAFDRGVWSRAEPRFRKQVMHRIGDRIEKTCGGIGCIGYPGQRDNESTLPAMQMRWQPQPIPDGEDVDFLDGLATITTAGDANTRAGIASHYYVANKSMDIRFFMNADGEMLFVPQENAVRFDTEFGIIIAEPSKIVVMPEGVRFRVKVVDGPIRGYIAENYGIALTLPERGPIGANCLANARGFLYPVAAYEDRQEDCGLYMKSGGKLYRTVLLQSPLDMVAWHGNYASYKYDLAQFSPVGERSSTTPIRRSSLC